MHILGVLLPENHFVKHALTHFYGIGQKTALRLCARVQIHDRARIRHLNQSQVTALTAFLSSPTNSPPVSVQPLAAPHPSLAAPVQPAAEQPAPVDRLREIKIESDLRRQMRENIAHQRMIGSYVGRRHAMHLPVRGQNTQSNARSARKLNRVERYN
ncbi:37S ribosomal protein SWS2, mitochondrial [Trametes pubescens]|uniref:37S ribosomal protein SWS2, mitochondrial n=1 Tax=Trametes pubescens TaxID=154538 RepID=A0A1M2VF17_TRAPU|nr:37S ribosomal protein SWS2, mitochondrial [Trametes pubescens]